MAAENDHKGLEERSVVVKNPDGSTTYVPTHLAESVPMKDQDARWLAKAGIVVGGLGLLTAITEGTVNFLYNCANENLNWFLAGLPAGTVKECVANVFQYWLPGALKHLW